MSDGDTSKGPSVTLSFDRGTLVLQRRDGDELHEDFVPEGFLPDPRTPELLRAPAIRYRRAVAQLIRAGAQLQDEARAYTTLELSPRRDREPFPHQAEALEAWRHHGRRGVVVLPTGAGKSYVAELAIAQTGRSTLVIVPTIDLMNQWLSVLEQAFGAEHLGGVGGGMFELSELTVSTYDSAYLHMDRFGDRFGLMIFDECHHLPGPSYAQAAECAIAPFRLGLTATPERPDGSDALLDRLIGPIVYRRDITDMAGSYLAGYETQRIRVQLNADERERYESARLEYREFVQSQGIRMSAPDGWARFLQLTCRSRQGRSAWRAWREQKRIALQSEAKLDLVAELLAEHVHAQVIIFTADNDTVYTLSRRHLIPAITHQTPVQERRATLAAFNAGELRALVTSRVLNEGVDMPAANVGIVLSGSGSVREHVQRLGRLLRRHEGKAATLYEVVTGDTGEEFISARRRDHIAYR